MMCDFHNWVKKLFSSECLIKMLTSDNQGDCQITIFLNIVEKKNQNYNQRVIVTASSTT
jgi:hypothetical protein